MLKPLYCSTEIPPPVPDILAVFPCMFLLFQLFPYITSLPEWLCQISRCGSSLTLAHSSSSVLPGCYMYISNPTSSRNEHLWAWNRAQQTAGKWNPIPADDASTLPHQTEPSPRRLLQSGLKCSQNTPWQHTCFFAGRYSNQYTAWMNTLESTLKTLKHPLWLTSPA